MVPANREACGGALTGVGFRRHLAVSFAAFSKPGLSEAKGAAHVTTGVTKDDSNLARSLVPRAAMAILEHLRLTSSMVLRLTLAETLPLSMRQRSPKIGASLCTL